MLPLFLRDEVSFCGVFDGTVGDHASEFVSQNISEHLSREIADVITEDENHLPIDILASRIKQAIRGTFLSVDRSLIEMCTQNSLHYASSTGVAVLIWKNLLTVSHVGDSKACIVKVVNNRVFTAWLTLEHKPNQPDELARINRCGGSLVYLHANKPYIRGADFTQRQLNGEHPKQLNYSRAFGGKDLKMYGLIAEPEVKQYEIVTEDRLVLIASDGLWDVMTMERACSIALKAREEGKSASEELVKSAIQEMHTGSVRDNVTVIAIFLNEE
jgi:protein phosphatase